MNIIVGIATLGRRAVLAETLEHLTQQTRLPDSIVVCPARPDDIDLERAHSLCVPVDVVSSERGLCAQRNAVLDGAGRADILVFFDDDFIPAANFLAEVERLFTDNPDIMVATGTVLADGIHGPGLSAAEASAILAADKGPHPRPTMWPVENAYGCNMVLRMAPIVKAHLRFDENLPLYAWQEDVDFCHRLSAFGRVVHSTALRGVHLGSKNGRTSGVRFGYSQVANPLYLAGKGTMRLKRALRLMGGNIAANILGSLRRQEIVDRRGRLRGNLLAFWDMLRGRMSPQRVLSMES